MRQGQQNRRGRGRNRKGQSPLSRNFESNGPDVKIRGSAAHIAEKYMSLARDAMASGDSIIAENYLQHAEHYNRIIMAAQAQLQQPFDPMNGTNMRPRPMPGEFGPHDQGSDGDGEGEDQFGSRETMGQASMRESARDQSFRDPNRARFERPVEVQRQAPGLDEQPTVGPISTGAEPGLAPPESEGERPRMARGASGENGFRRERPEGEGFRGQRRRGRHGGNGSHGERRTDQEPRERPPAAKDDAEDVPQG